jgi:hypothetical protein
LNPRSHSHLGTFDQKLYFAISPPKNCPKIHEFPYPPPPRHTTKHLTVSHKLAQIPPFKTQAAIAISFEQALLSSRFSVGGFSIGRAIAEAIKIARRVAERRMFIRAESVEKIDEDAGGLIDNMSR